MSAHVEQATEALHQMASFEPRGSQEVRAYLEALPELYNEMGAALRQQADRWAADHPYGGAVTEQLSELAAVTAGLADHASAVHEAFESQFDRENIRHDEPRPGEAEFDLSHNDD